jgi:hypothetical protein
VEVPANFGGAAIASKDLFVAREAFRHTISENGAGRRYFNCSDGALIEGALPTRHEGLSLLAIKGGKQKLCDQIIAGFLVYSADQFKAAWDGDKLAVAANAFLDEVLSCIEAADGFQGKAYLTRLMELLKPMLTADDFLGDRHANTVMVLFRGTLFSIIGGLEYYVSRVSDPDNRRILEQTAAQEFARAVESLREAALGILRHPDVVPDLIAERDALEEEFIAEVPHTWGRVSRNAPCPCGSGKKYKHCHGRIA